MKIPDKSNNWPGNSSAIINRNLLPTSLNRPEHRRILMMTIEYSLLRLSSLSHLILSTSLSISDCRCTLYFSFPDWCVGSRVLRRLQAVLNPIFIWELCPWRRGTRSSFVLQPVRHYPRVHWRRSRQCQASLFRKWIGGMAAVENAKDCAYSGYGRANFAYLLSMHRCGRME